MSGVVVAFPTADRLQHPAGAAAAARRRGARRLSVRVSVLGDHQLAVLSGRLEVGDAAHCRDLLVGIAGGCLVVDLAGLRSLDLEGMRALVAAKREVARRGGQMVIVGARRPVGRLFERAGLLPVLGRPTSDVSGGAG